jgi:hypothetical protein
MLYILSFRIKHILEEHILVETSVHKTGQLAVSFNP